MNIFGWGEVKDTKALELEVKKAHEEVVVERQARIEAEIALSRRDAGHAAEIEEVRSKRQVEVAGLRREIEELNHDQNAAIEAGINRCVVELEKCAATERANTRKELRTEFGAEFDALKKSVATLTVESAKNKGLYDGALLVIKALETQVYQVNKLNETLVAALPKVSAAITTPNPSVIVGSGNKS